MAQNITTIVLKTTGEQGETSDQEYLTGEFTENQDKLADNRKKLTLNAVHNIGVMATQEVMSVVTYELNTYLNLTDDYKVRVQMDNVSTTISKVTSMASSIMSGAITGAQIGGGYGAAAGAVIAAIGAVVGEGINLAKQHSSQNIALASGDIQAGYSQSRLGLIDNGRGTQN